MKRLIYALIPLFILPAAPSAHSADGCVKCELHSGIIICENRATKRRNAERQEKPKERREVRRDERRHERRSDRRREREERFRLYEQEPRYDGYDYDPYQYEQQPSRHRSSGYYEDYYYRY